MPPSIKGFNSSLGSIQDVACTQNKVTVSRVAREHVYYAECGFDANHSRFWMPMVCPPSSEMDALRKLGVKCGEESNCPPYLKMQWLGTVPL